MTLAALNPKPNGYPIILITYTIAMAAIGNKKTSVLPKKGNDLYPKCVMYQYHDKATAYSVLAKMRGNKPSPSTRGSKKN